MRMTYEQHTWDGELEEFFGDVFYALDEKFPRPATFTYEEAKNYIVRKLGIVPERVERYLARLHDYGLIESEF